MEVARDRKPRGVTGDTSSSALSSSTLASKGLFSSCKLFPFAKREFSPAAALAWVTMRASLVQ